MLVQSFFKVTLPSDSFAKKLKSQEVSSIADRQCVYGHLLSDSPTKDSDGSILCNQMILQSHGIMKLLGFGYSYISGKPLFPMLQLYDVALYLYVCNTDFLSYYED